MLMIILHYQVKQNLKLFVITPSDKESSYTLEDRSVLWKHTKTPNYSKDFLFFFNTVTQEGDKYSLEDNSDEKIARDLM